jgi:hypothetical protein
MSIFATDPVSLDDAVPATRSFAFQYQEPGSQVAGRYNEPAAENSAESIFRAAHTTLKDGRKRHLLQRSENCELTATAADGTSSDGITVTITVTHHSLADESDIANQVTLATEAISASGVLGKLIDGSI